MAKEEKKGLQKDRQAYVLRVSPQLRKALEVWAADEFRSVNGQIEFLLSEAIKKAGRMKKNIDSEID